MTNVAKLTFCGGVGTVTGANFLLEVENKKILVDCGLVQGIKLADDINWDKFSTSDSDVSPDHLTSFGEFQQEFLLVATTCDVPLMTVYAP